MGQEKNKGFEAGEEEGYTERRLLNVDSNAD
jgi:hypothetical protein